MKSLKTKDERRKTRVKKHDSRENLRRGSVDAVGQHNLTFSDSELSSSVSCVSSHRTAFTLMETGVAMAIVAVAMLLVVQLGYWSMRERASTAARFVAIEQAANVLETAQATPWESLTAEWADSQRIPDELNDQLPEASLTVKVEPDESQPLTKRVIVELRWKMVEGVEAQPLRLEGWFSRRSTGAAGGTP